MKKFLLMALAAFITVLSFASTNISLTDEKTTPKGTIVTESFKTIKVGVPAKIKIYQGDEYEIGIRTFNTDFQDLIKYEISDSTLNIWLDTCIPDEIYNINSEDIRIAIKVPNEVDIKTNSSLVATSRTYKKKTTSYENN